MYSIDGYANGCDKLDSSNSDYKKTVTVSSQDFATYKAGYKVVNLKPNNNWKLDNARFAVYAFASTTDYVWANLSDVDGDGIYSGWILAKYTKVNFCRMKANTTNDWANRLNQTVDITGVSDGYTHTIDGKIYLKPGNDWKGSSARFAAYFFGSSGNRWVSMTDTDGDGVYECVIPDGSWDHVIFGRMNPSISSNNFNSGTLWNKTVDISLPVNADNMFVIDNPWGNGDGTGSNGYWSKK